MFDKVLDRISTELAEKMIAMTSAKVEAGLMGKGSALVANAFALSVAPSVAPASVAARRGRPPGSKNGAGNGVKAAAMPVAKVVKAKEPKIKRDMNCRVEDCKNRSKGPGFGYMCAEHMKLPKAEQAKAREQYNLKHAAKG